MSTCCLSNWPYGCCVSKKKFKKMNYYNYYYCLLCSFLLFVDRCSIGRYAEMLWYIIRPALSPLMIFLHLVAFYSPSPRTEMLTLYIRPTTMFAECHIVKAEFLPPILLCNSPGSQNTSDYFTR